MKPLRKDELRGNGASPSGYKGVLYPKFLFMGRTRGVVSGEAVASHDLSYSSVVSTPWLMYANKDEV